MTEMLPSRASTPVIDIFFQNGNLLHKTILKSFECPQEAELSDIMLALGYGVEQFAQLEDIQAFCATAAPYRQHERTVGCCLLRKYDGAQTLDFCRETTVSTSQSS